MKNFKELAVWQKAMMLVVEVYELVKILPKDEMYALSDQIRRSAISIPSNIAEGHDRNSDKDFSKFLYIARGSCAELETQILLAISLGFFSNEKAANALSLCTEVGKMLNALIKRLATDC